MVRVLDYFYWSNFFFLFLPVSLISGRIKASSSKQNDDGEITGHTFFF